MASSLPPLSLQDAILVEARQRLQTSLFWRELAAEMRGDSQQLRSQATHLRRWSRHVRAQHASLRAASVALCHVRCLDGGAKIP
jgi:hypothetical protein